MRMTLNKMEHLSQIILIGFFKIKSFFISICVISFLAGAPDGPASAQEDPAGRSSLQWGTEILQAQIDDGELAKAVLSFVRLNAEFPNSGFFSEEELLLEDSLNVPHGTLSFLSLFEQEVNMQNFFVSEGQLSFYHDGENITGECTLQNDAVNIAKLRTLLADLPGAGDTFGWWAVERFTEYYRHNSEGLEDREFVELWITILEGLVPGLGREDIHGVLRELRRYHDMIVELEGWEEKISLLANDLDLRGQGERGTIYYVGGKLHEIFFRAGFPSTGRPCYLANVSIFTDVVDNEDIRLSNEGWIYSFWARRIRDGNFEVISRLLADNI